MSYARFEQPDELNDKILEAAEIASRTGKVRRGTNEVTKAIERSVAQLVIIAEDVDPPEIVMHLPVLCEEKQATYCYTKSKDELGRAIGVNVRTAATAIVKAGEAKDLVDEIKKKVAGLVLDAVGDVANKKQSSSSSSEDENKETTAVAEKK